MFKGLVNIVILRCDSYINAFILWWINDMFSGFYVVDDWIYPFLVHFYVLLGRILDLISSC